MTVTWKSLMLAVFTTLVPAGEVSAARDYPTVAIVDYVYGCMKANGNSRQALESCSCSIDVISSIIPYGRYEEAETFRSLGLLTGERGVLFRQSALARSATADLRRAQAEADVRCF
jgi:hypothetical protein